MEAFEYKILKNNGKKTSSPLTFRWFPHYLLPLICYVEDQTNFPVTNKDWY